MQKREVNNNNNNNNDNDNNSNDNKTWKNDSNSNNDNNDNNGNNDNITAAETVDREFVYIDFCRSLAPSPSAFSSSLCLPSPSSLPPLVVVVTFENVGNFRLLIFLRFFRFGAKMEY